MMRGSNNYSIAKKDLKDGSVQKKTFKGMVEYWVYRYKKSNILLPSGENAVLQNKENTFLWCIIACDNSHITKENKEIIQICGVRFTDKDMNEYLRKTKRHID